MNILLDIAPIAPETEIGFGPETDLPLLVIGAVALVAVIAAVFIVKNIKKKK